MRPTNVTLPYVTSVYPSPFQMTEMTEMTSDVRTARAKSAEVGAGTIKSRRTSPNCFASDKSMSSELAKWT